jgi:MscS family membrane protein
MLKSHPEIHQETIFVHFEKIGDRGLDLFLYFFTKTTKWKVFLEVQEDVHLKILHILDELGLSVALPARNIYVENGKLPKTELED